jgi:hypothetical protein
MTVGPCLVRDEFGRKRDDALVRGDQGRIVAYSNSLSPRAYRAILDDLLDRSSPRRSVRIHCPDGQPVWGVHVRATRHEGKTLVSLVNYTHAPISLVVETRCRPASVRELFEAKLASSARTVQPLEPVLLEFTATDR